MKNFQIINLCLYNKIIISLKQNLGQFKSELAFFRKSWQDTEYNAHVTIPIKLQKQNNAGNRT